MTKKEWIMKYTSRKFLLALVGVISAIIAMTQGEVAAGCGLMMTSIVGYLVAEGYVDAKVAGSIADAITSITDSIEGDDDED